MPNVDQIICGPAVCNAASCRFINRGPFIILITALTTRYLHRAGLGVQGIELEIHGTREGQRDADAEQDGA